MARGTKRSAPGGRDGGAGGRGGGRSSGNQQKRRKYFNEGRRAGEIRGTGIWFTCERRKEAKSVFEAYDLLNEVGVAARRVGRGAKEG